MRFAEHNGTVVDALSQTPIRRAKCVLCDGPVFLRGSDFGMLALLMSGFSPHYVHVKRGTCEYSPASDSRILSYLQKEQEKLSKEDPILC